MADRTTARAIAFPSLALAVLAVLATLAATTPAGAAPVDLTVFNNSVTGSASDGTETIPYRLFQPTAAAAQPGQKLPLVLFLHGMGDRGTDNVSQTDYIGGLLSATRSGADSAYVLAPQIGVNDWFQGTASQETEAMKLTIQALQSVIASKNVDTSRIYVTGLSMGGMGVWDILERLPHTFAAAVPMSGGGDPAEAPLIKDTPIWAFHGGADPIVPVEATRTMISALQAAGGSPKYTEIPGAGHVIWEPIYDDASDTLYPWLFSQQLGGTTVAPSLSPTVPSDSLDAGTGTGDPSVLLVTPAIVPEPTSLTGLALVGFALLRRRR